MLFEKERKEYDSTLDMDWTLGKAGADFFTERIAKGFVAVAEKDDKCIGYLVGAKGGGYAYRLSKGVAELDNMFVLPEYQRQGVGSALVVAFLGWCKENGLRNIKVEASTPNKEAIEFYRKLGFKDYTLVLEMNPDNTNA
jgi:GNAT superfamily N-acetyltransferase